MTANTDKIPKCPKCKSEPGSFTEIGEWSSTFDVDSAGFLNFSGWHQPESYYRVQAMCSKCGHVWTVRGHTQITTIREIYEGLGRMNND